MNRHSPFFQPTMHSVSFPRAGGWDIDMDERNPYFLLHWHKEMEILKLSGGKGEFLLDSQKYEVKDGDIVLISPQMLHYGIVTSKAPLHCRMVSIDLSVMGGSEDEVIRQSYVLPFEEERLAFHPVISASEYPDVAQQIDAVVSLFRMRADAVLLIKGEIIKLYGLLIDHGLFFKKEKSLQNPAGDLKEALGYIEENLSQKITVEELAELAGYSKYHFIRKFKEQTGATVMEYINSLRLSAASELLITTKLPISIVGERAGIPNTSYFIKLFSKEYAMTPLEFRKFYS